jgi:hypothetical protein
MVEDRISALEARATTLEDRVRELEGARPRFAREDWSRRPERTLPPAPVLARQPLPAPPRPAPKPPRDIEDFVGGSVLAWLGGFAVLAGLAFLLTMAISRGWIGEGARTALAGVISLGLFGLGAWLREHRDRTEAALVSAAVGIAGSFGTLVVAGPVYELVPRPVALLGAFVVGAAATAFAVRWRAQVIGWLGLLGALLAPSSLGALDDGGITFLAIGYAATIGVLVRQRWSALAGAVYTVTTVQWLWWLWGATPGAVTLALIVFGGLTAALAFGFEANRRGLHPVAIGPRAVLAPNLLAAALLVLNAIVIAAVAWETLDGQAWLAGLAAAHIVTGIATARVRRISRELSLIVIAIGVVLADAALIATADGLPLVLGWALSAIPFAALLGARSGERSTGLARVFDRILGPPQDERSALADRVLAIAGLIGQMTLAAGQILLVDARPDALAGPAAPSTMLLATGAFALVAWITGRLAGPGARTVLDGLALASLAHLTGLALEGAILSAVLAAEALALAELARRRDDTLAAWAAVVFAGAGLLHAVGVLAPPDALLYGLDAPLAAAAALLAVAVALGLTASAPLGVPDAGRILRAAAALTVLYVASVEVVTLGGPDEVGQTLLSVLWAVAGVAALIRGLVIDDQPLRRAALILLGITSAKVFMYDLASLDSMYRVGSLIGFGLLLMAGAFAYQRVRPQS